MSEHITGSQHDYEPEGVNDPATYSFALLWMNTLPPDPETLQLRELLAQQCRDAGIEEAS